MVGEDDMPMENEDIIDLKPWERDWSGNHAQEKPKEDKGFLAGAVDTAASLTGLSDSLTGLSDSLTGLSDGENDARNTLANRDGLIGFDSQRAIIGG